MEEHINELSLRFNMNKSIEMEKLKEKIILAKIPLHENARNVVMGKGNPNACILFVGEAPGSNEDLQGIPFVGAAGKNLDKLLNSVGLSLEEIYVTNILKYRPPENRGPNSEEMKAHTPFLVEQIKILQPKVVCSLGNYSTKFFLANGDVDSMIKQSGITSLHGMVKLIEFQGLMIRLIPLFHPAAIIYNRRLISEWEKDMKVVKEELNKINLIS